MAKRIIIDGIDVSVCPEFAVSHDGSIPCGYFCKETPDCSFKLKVRLEEKKQECEELKKEIVQLQTGKFNELGRALDRESHYKQALKDIEAYIKEYYYCESCENRETLDHILNLIKAVEGGNDVQ